MYANKQLIKKSNDYGKQKHTRGCLSPAKSIIKNPVIDTLIQRADAVLNDVIKHQHFTVVSDNANVRAAQLDPDTREKDAIQAHKDRVLITPNQVIPRLSTTLYITQETKQLLDTGHYWGDVPDGIPGGARRRFRIPAGAILARVTTERTKHDGAPATYDVIENLSSDDTGHARVDGGWRDGKWEIDHLHNDA